MGNKVFKCIVVGDSGVGKTSLLQSYKTDGLTGDLPATAEMQSVSVPVPVLKKDVGLELHDSATRAGDLDPLVYKGMNVVIVCFAMDNADSFGNAKDKWIPEVKKLAGSAKLLLVGTKNDLQCAVDEEGAATLAKESGAVKYINCTATSKEGVKHVVEEAVKSVVGGKLSTKKCVIQ